MNPQRFRLAMVTILAFLALVLYTVGFVTTYHVEVTQTLMGVTNKYHYGLFRGCSIVGDTTEKCFDIDYNKLTKDYKNEDFDAKVVYLTIVAYGLALVSFLFLVSGLFTEVTSGFMLTGITVFGAMGLCGIIGNTLYNSDITDLWDDLKDKYPLIPVSSRYGWSFILTAVGDSCMILISAAAFFLLREYASSQRPV